MMKHIKPLLLLISTILSSVPSHSMIDIVNPDNNLQSMGLISPLLTNLCDFNYQQALHYQPIQASHYQPIKAEKPVINDQEELHRLKMLSKFADERIMFKNVQSFPTYSELDALDDSNKHDTVQTLAQEDAISILYELYIHNLTGKYIPRDEYKSIMYLRKLNEFHQHYYPDRFEEYIYALLMAPFGYPESITKSSPNIASDEYGLILEALLLHAGSESVKSSLLTRDLIQSDPSCSDSLLKIIEELGDNSNPTAIHNLINYYRELNDVSNQLEYWEKKAKIYPYEPMIWN
ncbi:hypothetical protein [Psychrobacter lutiphocae]|uniref:hypothetical protein n=1 Tax=Psychrobacter lutiphocae TaxID=540500 RepID=UPI00038014D8|nr:hypothetical protein [Psychrobacter lutiphocae]